MRELCDAFKAQYRARLEDQKHGVVGRTPRAAGNVIASTPLGMGRTPAGVYGGRTPGACKCLFYAVLNCIRFDLITNLL